MKRIGMLIIGLSLSLTVFAGHKHQTVEGYIQHWKATAIQQMSLYGIPASITLAQGIMESGYGNSDLAVKANNHFGIKCHQWEGSTFRKDDDRPNECFRKYKNARDSYIDHSLFLVNRARYNFLFQLKITDYKGWAKGLKTAGYATNPRYAETLIHLIQKYNLDQYDAMENIPLPLVSEQERQINSQEHTVFTNPNRTKYIIAGKHDTFYQIAKEFGLNLNQLERWNDFPPHKDLLAKGDRVYIMRKRKKITHKLVQKIKDGQQPLWAEAQKYGVQLSNLTKKVGKTHSMNVAMNTPQK